MAILRRAAGLMAALAVMASLAGCGKKDAPVPDAFEKHDPGLYARASILAETAGPDGGRSVSQAEWELEGGTRHLVAYVSDIGASEDGTSSYGEAWSDGTSAWITVNGSRWQAKEYADGICDAPGVDLDAFLELMGSLSGTEPIFSEQADAGTVSTWSVPSKAVEEISGGSWGEGLADDAASDVTVTFGEDGLPVQADMSAESGGGKLTVTAYVKAWNQPLQGLAVPESVKKEAADDGYDLTVDGSGSTAVPAQANEWAVQEGFANEGLSALAEGAKASGDGFDRIELSSHDGFDEFLYYDSDVMHGGYWLAVASVEEYPDAGAAAARIHEMELFNGDAYGESGTLGGGRWYGADQEDGTYRFEAWSVSGSLVYGIQVEADTSSEADAGALEQIASGVRAAAGMPEG